MSLKRSLEISYIFFELFRLSLKFLAIVSNLEHFFMQISVSINIATSFIKFRNVDIFDVDWIVYVFSCILEVLLKLRSKYKFPTQFLSPVKIFRLLAKKFGSTGTVFSSFPLSGDQRCSVQFKFSSH